MEFKRIGISILSLLIAAALGSGITYWLTSNAFNAQISELKEKISELEVKERSAIVTKRISEQMEDIAYQQKIVSDKERVRAEEQSRIADMERGKAETERSAARLAESKAVFSAHQADSMREVAVMESERATRHMLEAQASQAKADTLFYNSLGRTLAHSALQQQNSGNTALASLMSYSAWYYTKEYKGNQYQQDVFSALVNTSHADKLEASGMKGNIRCIAMPTGGKEMTHYVAVTDYGEVIRLSRNKKDSLLLGDRYKPTMVYQNNAYDFRSALMTGADSVVVLGINGNVLALDLSKRASTNTIPLKLPNDIWISLHRSRNNTLFAIGQHHVLTLSADGKRILDTQDITGTITCTGIAKDGALLLFCSTGQAFRYDGTIDMVAFYPFAIEDNITAFVHQKKSGYDVLGTESGALYVCKSDGSILTNLVGHTSRITQLREYSRMVMSSSYDHSVRMWDLGNIGSLITSNEVTYEHWPLCFAYDPSYATLRIGLAEGSVRSLCISAKANAENTQKSMIREFTSDEWNYFIGKDVPYRTFMAE